MYQGKHLIQKPKTKAAVSYRKRKVALMLSLALILTAAIGGTAAYFMDSDWSISNLLIGKVSCTVEVANDNSSITVTNNGNVPANIRVSVVANWSNDTGIHYTQPTLTYALDGWTQQGDILYYNSVVPVGGTATLSFTSGGDQPSGYKLQIQALAEAIQENAALDAWGFSPSGN